MSVIALRPRYRLPTYDDEKIQMAATLLDVSEASVRRELDGQIERRRAAWRTRRADQPASEVIADFRPFTRFDGRDVYWSEIADRFVVVIDGRGHSAESLPDLIALLTQTP